MHIATRTNKGVGPAILKALFVYNEYFGIFRFSPARNPCMHDPMLHSLASPSPNMPSERVIPSGSKTDLDRWRLRSTKGARRWTYLTEEDSERHP